MINSSCDTNNFNKKLMIDAMCIWEAFSKHETRNKSETIRGYAVVREKIGPYAMKGFVLDHLLRPILLGWEIIKDDVDICFDWEYTPAFLEKAESFFIDFPECKLKNNQVVEITNAIMKELKYGD